MPVGFGRFTEKTSEIDEVTIDMGVNPVTNEAEELNLKFAKGAMTPQTERLLKKAVKDKQPGVMVSNVLSNGIQWWDMVADKRIYFPKIEEPIYGAKPPFLSLPEKAESESVEDFESRLQTVALQNQNIRDSDPPIEGYKIIETELVVEIGQTMPLDARVFDRILGIEGMAFLIEKIFEEKVPNGKSSGTTTDTF